MSDWDEELERPVPVVVAHTELSPDVLRGVIESFVLREGTDYGERDVSHDAKVAQVLHQLEKGDVQVVFDPVDSSVTIVVARRGRDQRIRDHGSRVTPRCARAD